jgi:hypothetical protein
MFVEVPNNFVDRVVRLYRDLNTLEVQVRRFQEFSRLARRRVEAANRSYSFSLCGTNFNNPRDSKDPHSR